MSNTGNEHPASKEPYNVQESLFALRDSLMNLKMSLLELAESSDLQAQQFAMEETQQLLARLRP